MEAVGLALQDVFGDAIKAQLTTDSLTASVVTNPTQDLSYPYVVIGEDSESSEDTNKEKLKSSVANNVYVHSTSLVQAKQISDSVLRAIGPNGAALTISGYEVVQRELEAKDLSKEFRPEGTLYHVLIRVRYLIHHA